MLNFVMALGLSLVICAISSCFVLFSKNFKTFVLGCFCFLIGVIISLISTDMFAGLEQGHWTAFALICIFTFEFLAYRYTPVSMQKSLYALPLFAFISLAMSTDLILMLFGLMLFALSFVLLARQRQKKNISQIFMKMNTGLLTFSYGTAVIFSRIGVLKLSDLRLKLSIHTNDEWLMFGFGLLILAVTIELYAVLLSLKKEKK